MLRGTKGQLRVYHVQYVVYHVQCRVPCGTKGQLRVYHVQYVVCHVVLRDSSAIKGGHGSGNKGIFESGQNNSMFLYTQRYRMQSFVRYHGHEWKTFISQGISFSSVPAIA